MRSRLRRKFAESVHADELGQFYNTFDIIGDIAIIKLPHDSRINAEEIANQIMAIHRNVKSVFVQTSPVLSDFRVRKLRLVSGEDKTSTRYRESGCVFAVDVAKCYFSPRLSYERSRIASLVEPRETIVNMFAGVGCFGIRIAKTANQTKVFSIDINPIAVQYLEENVRINKLYNRVIPILGDAKNVVRARFQGLADRVLMPLPEKALEYLPYALLALKKHCGWIHYYGFQHAEGSENPVEKTKLEVAEKLDTMGAGYAFSFSRIVRSTGPNWYQTALDIQVLSPPSKF